MLAPLLQHLAVLGDLVLALLGRDEIVGIDVLQPYKYAAHAGFRGLLDEVGNPVAQGVHLDGETDVHALAGAQHDHAVEQRLPNRGCGRNCRQ